MREAICACANDLPDHRAVGIIGIGVNDDGSPSGLEISDELLLQLAQMRDDGKISPFPVMTVRKVSMDGISVAAVVVEPSEYPPVRVRGRCWIRVGPRRAVATIEEEHRLVERRRLGTLPFDARPAPNASMDDLNLALFEQEVLPQLVSPEFLSQNGRSVAQQLQAAGLADHEATPTVTGVLLCGLDPSSTIPGAYIQFLRVEGTSLADPVRNERRITGVVQQAALAVEQMIEANIETAVEFAGQATETRRFSVPFAAMQQISRNALIHRTYEGTSAPVRVLWFDDRVEFHSPGGPYGQVTVENFAQPGITDYRNPNLASHLGNMGFVQQFGAGLEIARRELKMNGNPPPEFEVTPTNINVTIRFS